MTEKEERSDWTRDIAERRLPEKEAAADAGGRNWEPHARRLTIREAVTRGWRNYFRGVYVYHPEWGGDKDWIEPMTVGLWQMVYVSREMAARKKMVLRVKGRVGRNVVGHGGVPPERQFFQFEKESLHPYVGRKDGAPTVEAAIRGAKHIMFNEIEEEKQIYRFLTEVYAAIGEYAGSGELDKESKIRLGKRIAEFLVEEGADNFRAPTKRVMAAKLMEAVEAKKMVAIKKLVSDHSDALDRRLQLRASIRKYSGYVNQLIYLRREARRNFVETAKKFEINNRELSRLAAYYELLLEINRAWGDTTYAEQLRARYLVEIEDTVVDLNNLSDMRRNWMAIETKLFYDPKPLPVYWRVVRDMHPDFCKVVEENLGQVLERTGEDKTGLTIEDKLKIGQALIVIGVYKKWIEWVMAEFPDKSIRVKEERR